ncbi:hypothetical protein Pse7367_1234 [Thalassoporum mexicanum PCC 7367]|nr:hypothetical protein Pse7367_1234 [Pseudanabaena sp. PCC 7367]
MLQKCAIDPSRLAPFDDCMENYGIEKPGSDWVWNVISMKAVAYSCRCI